ncbi:fimbrial protein [Serratia fonticola]|uniref:Type 1 fimbrial protein n=1 Tax=Serratia fonticola TaxID=47917 RepID=A0AAW3WUA9_SERFO|nr:fimbrial protein [Serratia fonticola]MBC3214184.1 type 1 fimbrial protein [Serratia fonticola]NYA15107.1 type 1 fimbrial protein [Serratia fonticola]NYA34936.1 type 1 fimbrial protein [Serratia fonticola]
MKKTTLVVALSLAIGGFAAVPASAAITVAGGNINFTGEVTDATCLINDQTPNGAVDLNVPLETVSASELSFAGATAKPAPFTIRLGGPSDLNCTDGKIASVYFEPTSPAIDNATGWLKNTSATDPATHVQIQILNGETNSPINLVSGNNNHAPKTIVNQTAEYTYFGQYVAVGGAAGPGQVASTVKYSIVYQ